MIVHDLWDAAKFVAPIGAGVALLWLLGRDGDDDEHTVADYRPALHPSRRDWPLLDRQPGEPSRLRPGVALDVLPPAPAGADAGSPLYVETLFRTWHPDAPDVVAGRFLREIAAEESDDVIWNRDGSEHYARFDGSCWPDCPGCARDLTGVFPVVAVA